MRWRGNDWTMYDYKDRLHLDENFVGTLLGTPKEGELPEEVRRSRDAMAAIDANSSLRPAAEAKGAFGVFIRNRLRQLYEEQPDTDPQRAMKELALEAVAYGAPETADGATGFLDEYFGKVGSVSQEDAFVGVSASAT